MFLKSLSLKGFKSFADPTLVEFQPGVTVVVGPNGSGKSNVVDAVAWVLGAQSARVVRSSRMDDVIFAGTTKRPALGRAEVALTIDNSAGRLPIDFTEVTVTRTLFRTGESEYAINGVACRLLDVQELFSDTGVGRQQHVIIGQGQLDAVLAARPEERRMVVEEAAGVLKYRRRKERAERRLEASETQLSRLSDLQREVRRQMRPLERQAAAALSFEVLRTEASALQLFLAGEELRDLEARLAHAEAEREGLAATSARCAAELAGLERERDGAEGELGLERPEVLEHTLGRAQRLAERADGLERLLEERRRAAAALQAALSEGGEVAALESERGRVDLDLERCDEEAGALVPEWESLAGAEEELAERAAADAERFGEEVASPGPPPSAALRVAHTEERDRLARLREEEVRAAERAAALTRRREAAEERLARAKETLSELAFKVETCRVGEGAARATLAARERGADEAAAESAAAAAARHAASARVEALGLALEEARARAGLERVADLPGVLGTLLDVVEVDDGLALALEAAASGVLDAVLVRAGDRARAAVARLVAGGAGGALLPVLSADRPPAPLAPVVGTEPLLAHVNSADVEVRALLSSLFAGVLVVTGTLEDALDLALLHPERTFVTTAGDRLAPSGWRLGAAGAGVTRAAVEAASEAARATDAAARAAADADRRAAEGREAARREAADALRALDRTLSELERVEREEAAAAAELEAVAAEEIPLAPARAAAAAAAEEAATALAALGARLEAAERTEEEVARRLADAAGARRTREERARALAALRRDLEVRAAALEERRALLAARSAELGERLAARTTARERAQARHDAHEREDAELTRLFAVLSLHGRALSATLARVAAERDRRAGLLAQRSVRYRTLRDAAEERRRALDAARERLQALELDQTAARVRREAAGEALQRDLHASVEEALEAKAPLDGGAPVARERLRALEAELQSLGPVNPLARDELAEIQERSAFVEAQLEDVRSARRELAQVIRAVDDQIVEAFAAAYADVERHFAALVALLFPGGSGRLQLTAEDDLLETGIEIEARPAGRNVRRLSLLSGGERSMVALAFLFAVFRSRPSPFYLLDEVEAALDEVNLRRFLGLLEEFREEAQLIVVSHQKRTMEVADALYGVTMQPGGASKVVCERLRRVAEV